MPVTFDLTGLHTQTPEEILAEIQALATDPVSGIDANLDVSADSLFGRLFAIYMERERSLQELAEAVYASGTPSAQGLALTWLSLLTGTARRAETFSQVELTLSLNAAVTVLEGARVNVTGSPDIAFETLSDVTSTTAGDYTVDAQAVLGGRVLAPAGSLEEIQTPVPGWTAVTNVSDAAPGEEAESDVDLRLRRVRELNSGAQANLAAIVTDVRAVEDVTSAMGYENTTASTNGDGLPPHSFEIVVHAPFADDDAIAQAIWDSSPAGIAAVHGTAGTLRTGTATDVLGDTHTISYTDADIVDVYVTVTLTVDGDYPLDGDDQIRDALLAYVNRDTAIGADVLLTRLYAPLYSVPGVVDVVGILIGDDPFSQVAANLVIGSREVGITEASFITVAS